MKARYQYRFYPTTGQQTELAKLFGCCRVVWNDALALCRQSEQLPKNSELQKLCITQAKKTPERAWLAEVSNIPLQQSIADLGVAYRNFFKSIKGERKGPKVNPPRFKKRNSRQAARHQFSTRLVRENQTVCLEDLNVKGMVRNRCLSRAISECGFGMLRSLALSKVAQYEGRECRVISRWEPTSQVCSDCGYRWGKLDLSVRSVLCLQCGTEHDRDENASKNIDRSGMEQSQDDKRTVRAGKTGFPAPPVDLSSHGKEIGGIQLCLQF